MRIKKRPMSQSAKHVSRHAPLAPNNMALALVCGCVATITAVQCVWDALRRNDLPLVIGMGLLAVLVWRALTMARQKNPDYQELLLLPVAIVWTTWMASRSSGFIGWWLPGILLIVFLAPKHLVIASLSTVVLLIATSFLLKPDVTTATVISVAALVSGLSAAIYRHGWSTIEAVWKRRDIRSKLILDTAGLCHAELDADLKVVVCSAPLLRKLGYSQFPNELRLLDLFHPNDHASVTRTCQRAEKPPGNATALAAACDCRLLCADGSTSWVHARFAMTKSPDASIVVTLTGIENLVRTEEALRESQRKLASQALELSAQFDAAKSALHARQEVERLAQHDLRSPLKSIEAAAAMLRKGRILSTNEEQLLTAIEYTAARALSIVTMSLDLYRMEEKTFKFVPETIDLVTIARSVIAELTHHARSKDVRLDFDPGVPKLLAKGNEMLTTSVVENLVRNALEAAPEHSAVTLGLYQGVRVGLLIHNEGEVPAAIREDFFEKYVTHGKEGGTGLGTYSARLVARAQEGDLTMSSSTENGTLLALKLKRLHALPAAGTAPAEFQPSVPGALIELPSSSAAPASTLPAVDLLVVEDDDHHWLLLLSWLPSHVGARRAINGRDALNALTTRRPDLIVMDLEMPVMGGFEALRRIREMQMSVGEHPSAIYAFSGYDDPETSRRITESGFDGLLAKPAKQEEFRKIIDLISTHNAESTTTGVWVEKSFVDAFPSFIDSRRALVSDIEQFAATGDIASMRRAAHTLAGSPAIHGFDAGIAICRAIVSSAERIIPGEVAGQLAELRKMLSDPVVR
jgi:signal transduction histidine kinase/CheY-like chemotaxis protein